MPVTNSTAVGRCASVTPILKKRSASEKLHLMLKAQFLIRSVRADDAEAIGDIYCPYVRDNAISFETEVPTVEEFRQRISDVVDRYPWLVLETEGRVVAYAYANVFKARAAYDWTVESTIYVHQNFHAQGFGSALYKALLADLGRRGIKNAIAIIALPNDASVAFHERFGFKNSGTLRNVGYKFGTWWDIGYWQLRLPHGN